MSNIGQTIIIRTDLFNPEDVGLISAQVAHIHMNSVRRMILTDIAFKSDEQLIEWIKTPYIYVKKVSNIEALTHFKHLAEMSNLPVDIWSDTVYVRLSPTMKQAFPDVPVGISIGPDDSDKIRTVVGDLPLL